MLSLDPCKYTTPNLIKLTLTFVEMGELVHADLWATTVGHKPPCIAQYSSDANIDTNNHITHKHPLRNE